MSQSILRRNARGIEAVARWTIRQRHVVDKRPPQKRLVRSMNPIVDQGTVIMSWTRPALVAALMASGTAACAAPRRIVATS